MKWPVWLVIALIALPAGALAQEPAPASETDVAPLNAAPRELAAGEQVAVNGDGCSSGSEVGFHLYYPSSDETLSVSAPVEADGTFSQAITIPLKAPPGRVWLHAICLTEESEERVMQTVLLVSAPAFLITWTNVLFGAGVALLVMGMGISVLRHRHERRAGRVVRPRKRAHKKRSSAKGS